MGKKIIGRALALVLLLCMLGAMAGCGNQAKKEKIVYMTHNDKAVFVGYPSAFFSTSARRDAESPWERASSSTAAEQVFGAILLPE